MESKSGPINYAKFNNEEFDGLMAEAEAVSDLDQRAKILAQAEAVAMEGQQVTPIYYYVSKQLISPKNVGGVDNAPDRHTPRILYIDQAPLPRTARRAASDDPDPPALPVAQRNLNHHYI